MPSNKQARGRKAPLKSTRKAKAEQSKKKIHRKPTLEELLEAMPDEFLECRSYNNHLFKRQTVFIWGRDRDCTCRVSKCINCGCYREDYFLPNGKKMDSQYRWPEGYIITNHGRVPTDMVMRILMGRYEIANPEDLPTRVTKRLSNKALTIVNDATEGASV